MTDLINLVYPSKRINHPRLSLRANFSWTFIGNLIYALSQWGILISLAKLGNPGTVGQFVLGLAITGPLFMFFSLELSNVQAADAIHQHSFNQYFSLRLFTTVLALLATIGIAIGLNYNIEVWAVVVGIGIKTSIESISDIIFGLFQQQERMNYVATSLVLKGIASLAVFIIAVFLTNSLLYGIAGLIIVFGAILIIYDIPTAMSVLKFTSKPSIQRNAIFKEFMPKFDSSQIRKIGSLTWVTIPLAFTALLISLQTNIPRYFIERHHGEAMLGIFAALAYFERGGKLVMHALGRSVTARLSRYFIAAEYRAFFFLILKLASIGIILGTIGLLMSLFAGEFILRIFYRSEYVEPECFNMLMVASGFSWVATFLTYGLIASKHFRSMMFLYVVNIILLCLFCFLMVPSGGLWGSAEAVAISRMFEAFGAGLLILYISLSGRLKNKKTLIYLGPTQQTDSE
jgi:O-antigen/teichoic acid export membrane protein